ncbi:MAG: glycoside hydrolase family 18 protein, partial [Thiothrix sp.]
RLLTILMLPVLLLLVGSAYAGKKIMKPWVTGYITGEWHRSDGSIGILTSEDWDTLTHVIHHAAGLNSDGSLDLNYGGWNLADQTRRTKLIEQAHEKGVYVLFSVVNFGGYDAILADTAKRQRLVNDLVSILQNGAGPGYDGLDIDLEPVRADSSGNNPDYEVFISALQTWLKAINQSNNPGMLAERPLLTIATGIDTIADNQTSSLGKLLAKLQDKLDQINVMAYDLSTINEGVVWHDGALYDGGNKYPTYTARSVVSADRALQQFISAGVLPSKLGLGISAETRVWRGGKVAGSSDGVTAPMQIWTTEPLWWMSNGVDRGRYAQLMKPGYRCISDSTDDCSYKPEYYRWDDKAKMPYLSIDKSGSASDMFISYNDARSVHEKVNYVKAKGLGGVMLWELGRECLPPGGGGAMDQCVSGDGEYRPLLKAIRQTLRTGTGQYKPLPMQP